MVLMFKKNINKFGFQNKQKFLIFFKRTQVQELVFYLRSALLELTQGVSSRFWILSSFNWFISLCIFESIYLDSMIFFDMKSLLWIESRFYLRSAPKRNLNRALRESENFKVCTFLQKEWNYSVHQIKFFSPLWHWNLKFMAFIFHIEKKNFSWHLKFLGFFSDVNNQQLSPITYFLANWISPPPPLTSKWFSSSLENMPTNVWN